MSAPEFKKRRIRFLRQDAHKKKRLSQNWRKPKGIHSKMRLGLKGYRRSVSEGYRSPKLIRGLVSGLKPIMISSVPQLKWVEKDKMGIIISKGVGLKKRLDIMKNADKQGIRILNIKAPGEFIKKAEEEFKKKKEVSKPKKVEKAEKKKKESGLEETVDKSEEEVKEETKKEKDKLLTKRTIK